MVTKEEEMKVEEELLADTNGNGEAKKEEVKEEKKPDPMEEEHTTDFEDYPEEFFEKMCDLKKEKAFNDGSLVFVSDGKRKRLPVLMSSFSIGSVKMNREFLKAKRTMMECGYMNNTIDLMLPDFSQPDCSTPETAVRSIMKYIYTGSIQASAKSIRNITVLAAYLGLEPVLEKMEEMAKKLKVKEFNLEELKTKGEELGELKVVGLEKFIAAGFGNKPKAGDKRKNFTKNNVNKGSKKAKEEEKKEEEKTEEKKAEEPAAEATEEPAAEAAEEGGPADEGTEEAAAEPAPAEEPAAETPAEEAPTKGRGKGRGKRGRK